MSGSAPGPSGQSGTFGGAAGPARTFSPIVLDDDDDSGAEEGSSVCPIVIPDTWNGTTITLPSMGDQPPRSSSPIIIPESWMGRQLLLPARPRRYRARGAAATGARRSEPAPQTGGSAARRSEPVPQTGGTAARRSEPVPQAGGSAARRSEPVPQAGGSAARRSEPVPQTATAAAAAAPGHSETFQDGRRGRGARSLSAGAAGLGRGRGRGARGGRGGAVATPGLDRAMMDKVESLMAGIAAGSAARRSEPAPQTATAAAAPPGHGDTFQDGRRGRGGGSRGGRRGRGGRSQSVGAAGLGRGRGRGARGGRGGAASVATPGLDRAMMDKVESLMAGITAGTMGLRQGGAAGPSCQDSAAGPSRTQTDRIEGGIDMKAGLKSGVDMEAGLKKSPPGGPKTAAACRAPSPVAGPSRARAGCSSGGSGFPLAAAPDSGGDVTFGVLYCTAVGLQYYPGQLTLGGEPVRLQLSAIGAGGGQRDVRVVNGRGHMAGHLSREFAGVLAPHLEAGRVRLEGVCVDEDHSTAALEVTVRGRQQDRRQVCEQLRKMGFELEEPSEPSEPPPPPADLFCPVKPGQAADPERTLVVPRNPQQAVSERWAAVQRSLKEVEPCAAVASKLYPHQKQALGWMIAREASGAVARGTDAVCGGIVADDMGLGKTLQVIALILTHFKAGRPLAAPVPWRRRAPPAALALAPPPKTKSTPLQRTSPKIDWSNFAEKLKRACQETPNVKTEVASGSGVKKEGKTANGGERTTRTKRKPKRYIDSDSDEEEEEQVDLKRVKPEPTGTSGSASAGLSSASAAGPSSVPPAESSSASAAGPSSAPGAGPAIPLMFDSDEDLLSDPEDSSGPGGGADAVLMQAVAGPSSSRSSVDSGDYIPVPPSYCDLDGRSEWPGPRTTLIVCPLSVLDNWDTQLEQHVHRHVHLRVRNYHGPRRSAADLEDADVVMTTYATLGRELERGDDSPLMSTHFLRVVLDEGHTIRNPRSYMARAAFELRAERRWVLTGTPVQNRLKDLWSLLKFLRMEPYASHRPTWQQTMEQPVMRGNADAVERLQTLMASLALRRLKEQRVNGRPIVELPPRNVYVQHVTMEGEQRRRYDMMEERCRRGVARFIRDGTIVRRQVQILVMLLRLRQLCCHPQLVPDHEQPLPEEGEEEGGATPTGDDISPEERQRLVEALTEMLRSGSDEECPVCFEPLRQPVITVCSHVFCRPCLGRLMEPGPGPTPAGAAAGPQCPLCRGPLRAGQLVEVPEDDQKADEARQDGEDEAPQDGVSSAKVNSLMEGLRAMRAEDATTKALVVSQFTSLLNKLEGPLRAADMSFCRLDGAMTLIQRRRAMARFSETEPGTPCVMLLSLRAGGEGINLTVASRVFLLDPAWNPASEEQCFDRCHRLGQTRPVTVVKLVARDSVEERMLELQDKKRQLMTSAFGGMGLTAEQRRVQFINDMRTLFNL